MSRTDVDAAHGPAAREWPLDALIDSMPDEWRGTTFDNRKLLGREDFSARLAALLESGKKVGTNSLEALGVAEDYLRVATNVSTTLEACLAHARRGYDVTRVFTFASERMPLVAVLLATPIGGAIHLYHGDAPPPIPAEVITILSGLGVDVMLHACVPNKARAAPPDVGSPCILCLCDVWEKVPGRENGGTKAEDDARFVDALVGPNVLYIANAHAISPSEVAVVRKRMATPATTPMAEAMLRSLASAGPAPAAGPYPVDIHHRTAARATPMAPSATIDVSDEPGGIDEKELNALFAHLSQLAGVEGEGSSKPLLFTAGLSAVASLWLTLLRTGGADVVMASTAYGGSSQCTDLLAARASASAAHKKTRAVLRKHTFDLQGSIDLVKSIASALRSLSDAHGRDLQRTTVVFLEMPTNPDMKLPDLDALWRDALQPFHEAHGARTQLLLLIDTTLAPNSQVLRSLRARAPALPALVFTSLSKSVSRGITTAGALVGNQTDFAVEVMGNVERTATALDTTARRDQTLALIRNHRGVEERCRRAYAVATEIGRVLVETVARLTGTTMQLAFVTPAQAEAGFHTSTFSFNLPPPRGFTPEECAALAQRFVDGLTSAQPALFKPCVSFGQDNGKVYCTVPATSTQGAIKAEDKAKQAIGGVQLTRLSFPPSIDTALACTTVREALESIYYGKAAKRPRGE